MQMTYEKYVNLKLVGDDILDIQKVFFDIQTVFFDIQKIDSCELTKSENKNKWFIIRSKDKPTDIICKLLDYKENIDKTDDFDTPYFITYLFEDIKGNKFCHTKSSGYRDGGGTLLFCSLYMIKNFDVEFNEKSDIKINDVIDKKTMM